MTLDAKLDNGGHLNPFDLKIKLTGDVFGAVHFDPFSDAFPPTRNHALQNAWELAKREPGGDKVFQELVKEYLDSDRRIMFSGRVILRELSTRGYRAPFKPDVEIKITPKIQERGLWWNNYAKNVFEEKGVDGLITDPSHVPLALGMGQWLDAGNVFVEPRYVGNSLQFTKANLDLYKQFGVKPDTFAVYPHIKHWGLYRTPYRHLLEDERLSAEATYKCFEEIQRLMSMNKISHVITQGTWLLDPLLIDKSSPLYNEGFFWLSKVLKNPVEIGLADEINPVLRDYALAVSGQRKRAYDAGTYKPRVYASVVTLEELSEALSGIKEVATLT